MVNLTIAVLLKFRVNENMFDTLDLRNLKPQPNTVMVDPRITYTLHIGEIRNLAYRGRVQLGLRYLAGNVPAKILPGRRGSIYFSDLP